MPNDVPRSFVETPNRHLAPYPAPGAILPSGGLLAADNVLLDYVRTLTDDTGMIQHGIGGIPDAATGYTTDDNVRAFLAMVRLWRRVPERRAEVEPLLRRYLQFVAWAQRKQGEHAGWFVNFFSYDRRPLDERGTEDCLGRCLWCLGEAASGPLPNGCALAVQTLFYRALPLTARLTAPRAIAYSLLGICRALPNDPEMVAALAEHLAKPYRRYSTPGWQWFEPYLTYDNARLCEAMFRAGETTGNEEYLRIARDTAAFLTEHSFIGDTLEPIGCRGWWYRGGVKAVFDQQSLEAGGYAELYRLLGDQAKERLSLSWYTSRNRHGIPLYDPATGGVFDALTENGVNRNQGAESVITLLLGLAL
ncbi:MAG: hypothetical protein SFU56_22455 [Capsulimonadales bacterium]|nr:hypothetical protein [Capsulimonadales bacterium]